MKRITLLFTLLAFFFISNTVFATASIAVNGANVSPLPTAKKNIVEKFVAKVEKKITQLVNHLPIKKAETSKFIIAILLALFLGGIGIHRVYLGGKPILILWYLLLNIVFGLGFILALIDLIVMLIDGGTSKFDGNDKVFAAFG
jgi:TM2 domain-containing membrane protein YozV